MSDFAKIEELYHAALERPEEARAAFLDGACGGDDGLRREVESLLAYDERAADFIETPPEDLAASFFVAPDRSRMLGKTLNHYRVLSVLGAGGMGEVYLAEDVRLHRRAALKLLPPHFSGSRERRARFEQEARAASALNHPNIITIYGIEKSDDLDFIATEFVAGRTLRERIAERPFDARETINVARQIASALEAAHAVGIVHRDIKPANIMLRPDGYVKVLDFGLAKLTDAAAAPPNFDTHDDHAPRRVMGTINYMSPEQALGERVDARTDIFSLGVVLYEMLAGRQPFAGRSDAAVYNAIINRDPPALDGPDAAIPPALERIIRRALHKDREQRYQTAGELLADLKKAERETEQTDPADVRETLSNPAAVADTGSFGAAPPVKSRRFAVLITVAAAALLGVGLWFFAFRAAADPPIDSIAVLPFQNAGSDADSEYLSDGLTESLIYRLSQLPNLKVSPTSSVLRYKGRDPDVAQIAAELKVNAVLTGRLIRRGDQLTVSVELVDARTNRLLWGEKYERRASELLSTQSEIAGEISNNLRLRLSGEGVEKLAKKYTDNNEAYQLYLKGRYLYGKRNKDDILKGIDYFRQAVALDPNYALAYVGVADCYNILPTYAYLAPSEALPPSKAAAEKALELDPTLAEAHSALAFSLLVLDRDWAGAEKEYKRALELNPNSAEIHFRYGLDFLLPMNRIDQSIAEIRRAIELEPLSLADEAGLAGALLFAGRHQEAREQARRVVDLDPKFPGGRIWLIAVDTVLGNHDEAIALCEETLKTAPTNQQYIRFAGYNYAAAGRPADARAALAKLEELARTQYVAYYYVASIHAALGDRDAAFAALEKSYEKKDYLLVRLPLDPLMKPLRDDPRFAPMVKRLGLSH